MDSTFINLLCIIVLTLILVEYSIDIRKPYPHWVIKLFEEPYIRFTIYISLYFLTCYNHMIALLFASVVLFLHLDFVNLV